ncbi:ARM repeat-containing protein [Myriangium duriaei CBS 260.36]|uniref:ARM repeat-containing protein n=1 Tax=Myriangium duriaei CBS 260.36 TaxID=1168546 RepID=A0A9P4MN52_9PEZI|nr:ARM repeat-containing protein [Myriangium duriaei CBS 260.36]
MDTALIDTVRDVASTADITLQIQRLRRIKNDTVGHALRKELVITNGLLANLELILAAAAKASGKQSEQRQWSLEDEARLQATLILDTLANGGPSFVSPIMLSNTTLHLFNALIPSEVPSRIVIASLRALNSLAASSNLTELSPSSSTPSPLALQAFNKTNSLRLIQLLKSPVHTPDGRHYIDSTAGLIATACLDDLSRASLTKAGTLEALASLLADFALHDSRLSNSRTISQTPRLSSKTVCKILNAISAIIRNSDYRSYRLLLASAFRRVFTASSSQSANASFGSDAISASYSARSEGWVVTDSLLPKVLAPTAKTVTFGSQQFTSLQSSGSRFSGDTLLASFGTCDPLCSWLIHLSRTFDTPSGRLAALRLLALENASLDLDPQGTSWNGRVKGRERQLALLALPVAVKLVQDAITTLSLPNDTSDDVKVLREEACTVLALLIKGRPELQKTAVDAGAIKYVSLMLRKSFDPVSIARPMWSAQQQDSIVHSTVPSAQMGDPSLPPEIAHVMKIRAGALKALAAIAERDDTHRKLVIDQGMVNYLIDSLVPITDSSLANLSSASVICNFNTVFVMVAACEAASSLSRSVSLLRTSLIDAGIAKPILALLQHSDTDVQVAATSVCCNLVLDFSPMRQDLMDAGAMKTLCDHARRSNPALRVASLWALKHLVLHAPKEVKIEALDELGPGWLVQAISGDSRADLPSATPMGMSTPNAAGEQVDILNAPDTPEMDLDTPDEDLPDDESENGEIQFDQVGTPFQSSSMRSTLKPNINALSTLRILREREANPALQSREEDIQVQEQALDFVRNLMNGDDAPGMIDHLNSAISFGRLFELLHAKLEPPPPAPSRSTLTSGLRASSGSQTQSSATSSCTSATPETIVNSAVHIMTHISAASSRHKQVLIAQKPLLRALLPHFNHPDPRIRTICVWTVINLTWVEDQSDRDDARRRALELRTVGVEEKVRQLQGDSDLDVRERCKVAVRQLEELLSGSGGRGR